MALILGSGALIAFERGNREVAALIEATRRRAEPVITSAGCVAQCWRGQGGRQALLARLLAGAREVPLEPRNARQTGSLCARAGSSDVVDGHVVLLAGERDTLITSDPQDLQVLLNAAGTAARLIAC